MTSDDLIQRRAFTVEEVARLFRVPVWMLASGWRARRRREVHPECDKPDQDAAPTFVVRNLEQLVADVPRRVVGHSTW